MARKCDGCTGTGIRGGSTSHTGLPIPAGFVCVERCDLCDKYADDVEAAKAFGTHVQERSSKTGNDVICKPRKQIEPFTDVMFRVFPDTKEVIAIMPGIVGSWTDVDTCASFMHVGQHGTVNLGVICKTKPAVFDEYKHLQKELESAPYFYLLNPVCRATARHRRERAASLKVLQA